MGLDRSLLVTGGGGQVGLALAQLVPEGTHLTRAQLDITNRDAVHSAVLEYRPRVIVNAAAFTNVDAAETDPRAAFRVNAEAVSHLVEAADETGALLVQISSDYVFAGDKGDPYREDDETGPLSVYGKSKLAGEEAASDASDYLIVRTSWVFGRGRNFIGSILEAAESRDELMVISDQIGRPTPALDLADGILGLVERDARGVYHLAGSGEPGSWADLAELVLVTAGKPAKVTRVTTRDYTSSRPQTVAPRPMNSVLHCGKAAELGVKLRPWRQAVIEYVKEIE